jgi:hypothetical protein
MKNYEKQKRQILQSSWLDPHTNADAYLLASKTTPGSCDCNFAAFCLSFPSTPWHDNIIRATSLDSDSLHPEGYCLLVEVALIIARSEEDVILILFQEPIFG